MKKINLHDIPKQDPFVAPQGYLENLPQLIQQQVVQKPAGIHHGSLWFLLPKLQGAYTLLLLIFISLLIVQQAGKSNTDAQTMLNDISEQELVNYLSNKGKLSIQELAQEKNWQETDIYAVQELAAEDVLEQEILQQIDTYTADELWK